MEEYYGATSSDITIVPTEWLKNLYVKEFNIPSDHLKIVPYGMDIDNVLRKTDQYPKIERPSNKKVIICSARLVPVKGHECLLNALAMLKEERNDWICWIVGDGPLRKQLEQQAKRMNLKDEIIFLGNRNDVPSLLHQSDIFVLPSLQDNQPFSVMEAQVVGKPVVVSDAGGIPEMVVHGETGLISPAGNDEVLYQNLKTLIEDDDYRNSIAERGKQRALTQWALGTMVDKTLEVYKEVGL